MSHSLGFSDVVSSAESIVALLLGASALSFPGSLHIVSRSMTDDERNLIGARKRVKKSACYQLI